MKKKRKWEHKYHRYVKRNVVLRDMGFPDYTAYLASPLWKSIRTKVLAERPNCLLCRKRATVVHHRLYKRQVMEGEALWPLVSLCHSCHESLEWTNGKKNTLGQANMELNIRMKTLRIRGIPKSERKFIKRRKQIVRLNWPSSLCQETDYTGEDKFYNYALVMFMHPELNFQEAIESLSLWQKRKSKSL